MASFLGRMKEKREATRAQREYDLAYVAWTQEHELVDNLHYMATNLDEVYRQTSEAGFSIRLKKDEHVLISVDGAGLVEPRATAGHYQGGSSGVSFRVAKGVNFRVGQHKGTYVRGPEEQKMIDSGGALYITTQRVIYTSMNRNREWAFAKTIDVMHDDLGVTYMNVSNRQKVSGFVYGEGVAREVQNRLVLAMAVFDDEVDTLVAQLDQQLSELKVSKPVAPSALPS
ncbi:MAG: hypothetical protein GY926_23030 [bacterium]|nr:hypothetical protein [bacterium]